MSEITRRLLATEDDQWVASEGYVIIWETTTAPGKPWMKQRSYVWGPGPPGNSRDTRGGWTSMRHAHMYSDYGDAVAAVPSLIAGAHSGRPAPSAIRIVKVRIRQPVIVLDDLPADVLQRLAEV
jgi:hypothetical protein